MNTMNAEIRVLSEIEVDAVNGSTGTNGGSSSETLNPGTGTGTGIPNTLINYLGSKADLCRLLGCQVLNN